MRLCGTLLQTKLRNVRLVRPDHLRAGGVKTGMFYSGGWGEGGGARGFFFYAFL